MIALRPRLSEKSYNLSQLKNTYIFDVDLNANKQQIKSAVEQLYKVSVTGVNVLRKTGKVKQSNRRGRRALEGQEATKKRAYVTLKQGDKIALFEEAA